MLGNLTKNHIIMTAFYILFLVFSLCIDVFVDTRKTHPVYYSIYDRCMLECMIDRCTIRDSERLAKYSLREDFTDGLLAKYSLHVLVRDNYISEVLAS